MNSVMRCRWIPRWYACINTLPALERTWFTQGDNGSGPRHSEPVDHALGRSRGGSTTKIHLACDGHGRPLAFVLTAGNINDFTRFTQVLAGTWMPKPGRGQSWKLYLLAAPAL